jgi:hypothetical protein
MIHFVSDQALNYIGEMDKKIGEFMQKRADLVNKIIDETAQFDAGDLVEVLNENEEFLFYATVVQALFLKRRGIIAYRLKKEDGTVFTNEKHTLRAVNSETRVG